MTTQQLKELIDIISNSNSCKVSFNVPVENNYNNVHTVLIHECNADCTKKMHEAGYSLFMTEKGLSIDKW